MRNLPSDKPKVSGNLVLIALELFTILAYGKGKEAAARVVRAVVHEYLRTERTRPAKKQPVPPTPKSSGIAALWGPAHGGANEAALKMLEDIGDVSRVKEYVQGVKDKKYRLMGFGHRVYKNMDPRAKVMRETCYEVLKELKLENNKLFELAMELEKTALSDPYFIERKLYPNVDFYSGIVLRAIGIPTTMFTVIFALARTIGWVSQWNEMISDAEHKIGRPRQLYRGATKRNWVSSGSAGWWPTSSFLSSLLPGG